MSFSPLILSAGALPSVPVAEELPFWHRDLAQLDAPWADEAARVLQDLALSDQKMVQANAFGSDGEKAAQAYGVLLEQMHQLEEATVKRGKGGWIDNIHRRFLGDKRPLVERMEELMVNRHKLVDAARKRVNGLREALDLRSEVDERAMVLLERLPEIEQAAQQQADQTLEALAQTPGDANFGAFRDNEMRHRKASRLPAALLGVRQQLQTAVMLGAPLRDSIDQFLHLEEMNQSNFELSFGAHVSNLAVLQGMQQSALNTQAAQAALNGMQRSGRVLEHDARREGGSSYSGATTPSGSKTVHQMLALLESRRQPAAPSPSPDEKALVPPAHINRRPRL